MEEQTSIWSGVARLVRSSKALVVLASLAVIWTLFYLGRLDVEVAVNYTQWMIGLFLGAVAIEDGATKLVVRRSSSVNPEALSAVASLVTSLGQQFLSNAGPAKVDIDGMEAEFEDPPPPVTADQVERDTVSHIPRPGSK